MKLHINDRSEKQRLPSSSPSMDKQMGGSMATGEGALEAPTNAHTLPHNKPGKANSTSPTIPRHPCGAKLLPPTKQTSFRKINFILVYKHWDQCHNFSGSLDIAGSLPLIPDLCHGSQTHGTINTFTNNKYLYCDCYSCLLHNLHCSSKQLQGRAASGGSQCSDALQELQTHATLC